MVEQFSSPWIKKRNVHFTATFNGSIFSPWQNVHGPMARGGCNDAVLMLLGQKKEGTLTGTARFNMFRL